MVVPPSWLRTVSGSALAHGLGRGGSPLQRSGGGRRLNFMHALRPPAPAGPVPIQTRIVRLMMLLGIVQAAFSSPAIAAAATDQEDDSSAGPAVVRLIDDRGAPLPILLEPLAADSVHEIHPASAAAELLADYLQRMTGGGFPVQQDADRRAPAIRLALAGHDAKDGLAPALTPEQRQALDGTQPERRENYLLRTDDAGLHIIAATPMALEHAVWDLLDRLGYRHFFPGDPWQIVPLNDRPEIAVDELVSPGWHARRIWFGFNTWTDNRQRHDAWNRSNRATSGINLNTGHAYDGIFRSHREVFDQNPAYIAELDGVREARANIKFCLSNPGLRQLFVDHALNYFTHQPDADSMSLDPSDGGGWCECDDCAAMGSVSDQVITLSNQVAEAVEQQFPGKRFGLYAYNEHSPPPSIDVHPNLVISVATSFIRGGYTVDELIEGWQRRGATIGIREYYSVIFWDHDQPRSGRGSNLDYLADTTPRFHRMGARYMSSESSDNWGPHGLGYYLAARMLWNPAEAGRLDHWIEDFLHRSFGPAHETMAEFYGLLTGIDGSRPAPMSDDYLGRLYRLLDRAWQQAGAADPDTAPTPAIAAAGDAGAIRLRLSDLALYLRFLSLWQDYRSAGDQPRQAAFEQLMRFSYRIRDHHMIHSFALWRTEARDRTVAVPEEAKLGIAETDAEGNQLNPWKDSRPVEQAEVRQWIVEGIEQHQLLDFQPRSFAHQLQPVDDELAATSVFREGNLTRLRGVQQLHVWLPEHGRLKFRAATGLIYDNRGGCRIELLPVDAAAATDAANDGGDAGDPAATVDELLAPAALLSMEIPPDKEWHDIELVHPLGRGGWHVVQLSDRSIGTSIEWPDDVPMVMESSIARRPVWTHRWSAWFYVPADTEVFGAFASGRGRILDDQGEVLHEFSERPGYFSFPVKPELRGRFWRFEAIGGSLALMTVPPWLTLSPNQSLLPPGTGASRPETN